MEHEDLIRKHLGVNAPDWIVANVQKAIDEALNKHDVVGQSEQLSCSTCKWLKRTDDYCDTCFKFEKHEPAT